MKAIILSLSLFIGLYAQNEIKFYKDGYSYRMSSNANTFFDEFIFFQKGLVLRTRWDTNTNLHIISYYKWKKFGDEIHIQDCLGEEGKVPNSCLTMVSTLQSDKKQPLRNVDFSQKEEKFILLM